MAQAAAHLGQQALSCTICGYPLKDPLPCGHNFCRSCIQSYWGREGQSSCPQCRQSLTQTPTTNSVMAALTEQMKRTDLQNNPGALSLMTQVPINNVQLLRQLLAIQENEAAVQKLQQDMAHFRRCADEVVRHSDQSLSGMIQWLEFVHKEVTREIRGLQQREEAKLTQLYAQQQLRTNISDLSSLLSLGPGEALFCSLEPPSLPLGSLEQAALAVTALTDQLKATLNEGLQNITQGLRTNQNSSATPTTLSLSEPKTREEFIKYAREIVLDPNTAHEFLTLSRGNRGATRTGYGSHPSDHPDRFSHHEQVLSRDGLTGRCYWELEWSKLETVIAVSYKSIGRKGNSEESEFGYNDKSWALNVKTYDGSFWHHGVQTKVAANSISNTIGVYVNHSTGVLEFYNIDVNQSMSLIHREQTRFTQPLFVGVKLRYSNDTVNFPKLKY